MSALGRITRGVISLCPVAGHCAGHCYDKVSTYVVGIDCCGIDNDREETTIGMIREKKTVLETEKAETITHWDNEIVSVDAEINTVDDHIAAAQALGVLE